jgi:hypothetical protein
VEKVTQMGARSIGIRALTVAAATLMFLTSAGATRLSDVEVVLKGQNTIGTRPDGSTVLIDIKLEVGGPTTSALNGTGRHFGSGGVHAYWDVTGGIVGNILTLTGTVQNANTPVYVGSPIQVTADLTTEVVTFAFGPLTGGPFEGHTIVTEGSGRIQVQD